MRIRMHLRTVGITAAFFVCTSQVAVSQAPSQTRQPLLNDISVTLPSGAVVRIRNMVVFRGASGDALTVYIQTPTSSSAPERLASEAKEVAGLQIRSPTAVNLASVSVAVCRTNECVQMREKPEKLFVFVRKPNGSLEAERQPPAASTADSAASLMRIASLLVGERREPVCGSQPPQGEWIWFPGGDYCEWVTPTRGRIVAQRDEYHRVHTVILNRQTNSEADSHGILDSLAVSLRSFGLSERECPRGSSPAGAVRSWLYEDQGLLVHISEITPPAAPPRLLVLAVDNPRVFPRTLCQ